MNKVNRIQINLSSQTLKLFAQDELIKEYPVSSAKNGAGEIMDSECTPRGNHIIAEKIGANCQANAVFVGRRASGEIYESSLREKFPERDWILTRILWLRGTELGRNLGANVDSYDRYIYIHGTPEDVDMSICGSRGCVRIQNNDIIELFDLVDEGASVIITE
jgi:L,D-transpeptidase YbiS